MEDIAVVGIGLRFPGDASSPEELWKVLERGESQWSEFPKDRLNIDGYYHPGGDRQGSISFRGAHFLQGDISAFDAPFFSVAAEDAKAIDPQQRILLEASYEALENAGVRKEDIDGSDTAVYVGSFVKDYEQICLRDPDWQPQYAATGNGIAIMANRISYFFNLHGPSMTIDTGCSGSLVSVHLAAQSLRNGESSLAIAAGAGMILTPNTIMPMTALNFLSPDGKCFTFDARANGYGRGEGIGVVILKRLSDALRDNDTIRAVIRGTRVNQDGHTTGITLPSKEAQIKNIRGVYESAGLSFDQTGYVECHGTGTQAGDWRELKAISESLGSSRDEDNPIIVSSIKPNIGHLEGAAGVAGLIKGVLTLEKGTIPPNINFQIGNPNIDFEAWKVKVPTNMLDWPLPGLRRVSVNCFGFGGTNAHVIMDEAPRYLSSRGLKGNHSSMVDSQLLDFTKDKEVGRNSVSPFDPQLLCYSSHEKAGTQRIMQSHLPYFTFKQDNLPQILRDYSYTLACRRSNLEWRSFTVASSPIDLKRALENNEGIVSHRALKSKPPKLCFIFCGQGAQWAQMGKDLLSFKVFRDSLEAASTYMAVKLNSSFDLLEEILRHNDDSRISDPEIAQPSSTALQVALVDLLGSFSIAPNVVVGHSSGEVAAAYASKALSREAAWRVSYYRGLAASTMPSKDPELRGAMLVIGMSLSEVQDLLCGSGYTAEVACINSPRSITVSGHEDEIEMIMGHLSRKGVFNRRLPVNIAYHSSHMKLVAEDYLAALGRLNPASHPETVRMISSVIGETIQASRLNEGYWVKNLLSPVHYVSAIESLMNPLAGDQPDMIIELSPSATLKSPSVDIIDALGLNSVPTYHSILDRRTHGASSLLNVVGNLWAQGYPVDMKAVISRGYNQASLKCLSDLPPYPWNHSKSYWHESHLGQANRFREFARQDLIGAPTADAISFEPRWRGFLRVSENPWLQDHQIQKTIVYPAAGMVAMALEGISQVTKEKANLVGYEVKEMKIEKAMIIPSTAHGLETAMNFKRTTYWSEDQALFDFVIYSKQLGSPWEQNASGSVQALRKHGDWRSMFANHQRQHQSLKERCKKATVPRQLYELLDAVGVNYGHLFQNITQISTGDNACVCKVRVPDTKSKMPAKFEYPHIIHPATLDAIFHTLFAIDSEPMVPTYIKNLFVSAGIKRDIGSEFTGYAVAERAGICGANAQIAMTQSDWDIPSISISGLHFSRISNGREMGSYLPNHRNLCTEIVWAEDITTARPLSLEKLVTLLAHKHPGLSVLQIGGTDFLMKTILRILTPDPDQASLVSRYTLTTRFDAKGADLLSGIKNSPWEALVEVRAMSGTETLPQYDLVIRCDPVDKNTHDQLIKPGGFLFSFFQTSDKALTCHSPSPLGRYRTLFFEQRPHEFLQEASMPTEVIFLLQNTAAVKTASLLSNMTKQFQQSGFNVQLSTARASDLFHDYSCIRGRVVISLLDFPEQGGNWSVYDWTESDFNVFYALQKHAKGIIWVTSNAHMNPSSPQGSPIIALARTLMSEDPLKTIVTLDVSTSIDDLAVSKAVTSVFQSTFFVSHSAARETEYAEMRGRLYIPRLKPVTALNKLIEKESCQSIATMSFKDTNSRLRLQIDQQGIGDDNIIFTEEASEERLGADEVEISFSCASVTHTDLEGIMGRSVDSQIGLDVYGTIQRVGSKVHNLKSGDYVAALTSNGAFSNRTVIDHRLVRKTGSIDLLLSHYVAAGYAFLRSSTHSIIRSVLIHAGASTYGLAAVEMAQLIGCEVFVTVIGPNTERQREILRCCGLKDRQVIEAHSDSLGRIISNLTCSSGVDLVYNSTQHFIEPSFSCVRKGGTVFQFANKSPNPSPIRATSSAVSLVNFDLPYLLNDDPEGVAEMLHTIMSLFPSLGSESHMRSSEYKLFELHQLKDAFRHIETNPYSDRVSVYCPPDRVPEVAVHSQVPTQPLHESLSKHGTYVLSGGLGGLGRSICNLLVENGVKHVAFLSRSGASSSTSVAFVQDLIRQGIDAQVFCVDICDKKALHKVVEEEILTKMPPIHGVFQCAAVIKDAVFDNMNYTDWCTAFRPKTLGSDNLMQTLGSLDSDPFFVFLSSSAGVIGTRGQANYSAGNCFQDALARKHRAMGKHAVSIDLGPVLGAGMLAEDEEILDMLKASGFYGIRHQDFLKVVTHAITKQITPKIEMPAQVIMGLGTGGLIQQNQPADPYWSRTTMYNYLNLVDMPPSDLSTVDGSSKNLDMKSMLARCADGSAAAELITTGLCNMLAKAMNMLPEEIDASKPPNLYGVDSLVAVGVRNWVFSNCGVQVSVFEVLSDRTVGELAVEIATRGSFGADRT